MRFFFLIALIVTLCGCGSTSKKLESYPDRLIDRPYNPPEEIDTWRTETAIDPKTPHLLFYPLLWDHSLTDSISVTWSPFPLDWKWTLIQSKNWHWGASVSFLGAGYTEAREFVWRPALKTGGRYRWNDWGATDVTVYFQPELSREGNSNNAQSLGSKIQNWIQLSDPLAIGITLDILFERRGPGSRYFKIPPPEKTDFYTPRLPVGLSLSWLFFKRWEFNVDYEYLRLLYPQSYTGHQLLVQTTHYW